MSEDESKDPCIPLPETVLARMNREYVWSPLRYLGIAIAFALCGVFTARFLDDGSLDRPGTFLPAPFALLCALLFLHKVRAVLAVPLMFAVWKASYIAAWAAGVGLGRNDYLFSPEFLLPGALGGLIGGLGLVLCAATCYCRLFSIEYLFGGSLVGGISGAAFAPWLQSLKVDMGGSLGSQADLQLAFAIWDAAVGTYLYAICTGVSKRSSSQLLDTPSG